MLIIVFNAAVGGWCLRSAIECVADGRAGWAAVLGILGTLNLMVAVFSAMRRSGL